MRPHGPTAEAFTRQPALDAMVTLGMAGDQSAPGAEVTERKPAGPSRVSTAATGSSGAAGDGSRDSDDLRHLLGGRRGAIEASLPALVFVVAVTARLALEVALAGAVAVAAVVAVLRWRRAQSARAGLLGLLGVLVAALVVLRTGRAVDFFAVQVVSNLASAVAWMLSIAVRRPLLGIVVGSVLRQGPRWRSDPDLVRGYSRASWWWVASYLLRLAVFVPLWAAGSLVALGVARAALSWPLIAAVLALSWHTLRRTLPAGHPGIRHPVVASSQPSR